MKRRPAPVRRLRTVIAADNRASLALLAGAGHASGLPERGILDVTVEAHRGLVDFVQIGSAPAVLALSRHDSSGDRGVLGPRWPDFAAEMLGGLPRQDQRAAVELYVRGLLTDRRRKSMQPMAERLRIDHQRLQRVHHVLDLGLHGSAAECGADRSASAQPVKALIVDDAGFPKDLAGGRRARPWQHSSTLGEIGNCQFGVSVHLVNEQASSRLGGYSAAAAEQPGVTLTLADLSRRPRRDAAVSCLASLTRCVAARSGGWRSR